MTEHFFRHGDYLTIVTIIDDPIFLEEPFIRTSSWVRSPDGNVVTADPFQAVDELGNRPLGWVPHYPLGAHHREFGEKYDIPFEATQGGKDTTYPEYMLRLDEMKKAGTANGTPTRRP